MLLCGGGKERCACIEQATTLQAAWGALWLGRFLEAGFSCTFCMQFPKLIDTFLHEACTAYVCRLRSCAPVRPSACYLVCAPTLLSFADLDLNTWEDEASCLIYFFFSSLYKSGCELVWGQCISIASCRSPDKFSSVWQWSAWQSSKISKINAVHFPSEDLHTKVK